MNLNVGVTYTYTTTTKLMLVSLKLHNTLKNNLFGDYKGSTKFAQGGMCFLTLIYEMYELCPTQGCLVRPTHWCLFFLVSESLVQPTPGFPGSRPCFPVSLFENLWSDPRRSIKIVDHNQG